MAAKIDASALQAVFPFLQELLPAIQQAGGSLQDLEWMDDERLSQIGKIIVQRPVIQPVVQQIPVSYRRSTLEALYRLFTEVDEEYFAEKSPKPNSLLHNPKRRSRQSMGYWDLTREADTRSVVNEILRHRARPALFEEGIAFVRTVNQEVDDLALLGSIARDKHGEWVPVIRHGSLALRRTSEPWQAGDRFLVTLESS